MKLKAWILIAGFVGVGVPVVAIGRRFGFTPTGFVCLLLLAAGASSLAIKLSLNLRWTRKLILRCFSGERASLSCALNSGAFATGCIFLLGGVLGLAVYSDRTNAFYRDLSQAYCRADVLSDVFAAESPGAWPPLRAEIRKAQDACAAKREPGAGRLSLKQAFKLLKHFQLLDPDDPSEEAFEASARPVPEGAKPRQGSNRNAKIAAILVSDTFQFRAGDPTIDLVLNLAAGLQGATQHPCTVQSDALQRTALAAALAQQPHTALEISGKEDLMKLRQNPSFAVFSREPIGRVMQRLGVPGVRGSEMTQSCTDEDLRRRLEGMAGRLSWWSSFTFERPAPELTAQEIGDLALRWSKDLRLASAAAERLDERQAEAVFKFLSVLLTEMRGTEEVRAERRWVNALIGYERCAILILAFVFLIFLFVRFIKRLPHEIHRAEISGAMATSRARWFAGGAAARTPAAIRRQEADELRRRLMNGRLADEEVQKPAAKEVTTIPLRILGAALDEMDLSHQLPGNASHHSESTFVETLADGERRSLDASRLVFDTLLPTFPAIGFVGTVSSLLIAMSEADRIVRTDEAMARGMAASQVTDILSLCFSTTLLALLGVLAFSPLSLMQASRERKLIDDAEYQVQTVLRPEQP